MELMNCPSLAVPKEVMHHVVRVESSYNPYAIGVVGGRLARQPQNLPEALATVRMLETKGYNFSLGLAQVNRYNLGKYGIDSYEKAFDACPNLQTGSRILAECYSRSGGDWGKSFSCYYSGNFITGFRHGYVQKIYASMRGWQPTHSPRLADAAIEVMGKPARRHVEVSRYPLYAAQPPGLKRVAATVAPAQPVQNELLPGLVQTTALTQATDQQTLVPGAAVTALQPIGQAHVLSPSGPVAEGSKPANDEAFVF